MLRKSALAMLTLLLLALPVLADQPAASPDDRTALQGLSTGKAVFDIRIGDARQLLFALKVIEETATGLQRQQVTPDFILTFRGATVPLLRRTPDAATPQEQAILAEIHERLATFHSRQMPLEACNVAARLFKVEAADLDPALKLVGNSIVSLIGYQQQGYALIPMY